MTAFGADALGIFGLHAFGCQTLQDPFSVEDRWLIGKILDLLFDFAMCVRHAADLSTSVRCTKYGASVLWLSTTNAGPHPDVKAGPWAGRRRRRFGKRGDGQAGRMFRRISCCRREWHRPLSGSPIRLSSSRDMLTAFCTVARRRRLHPTGSGTGGRRFTSDAAARHEWN
jgi:hypothetical protein